MTGRPPLSGTVELDTGWMVDAACARVPGLPWIENLQRVPAVVVAVMAQTCAGCPVRARCEAFVEEAEITAGYWAGHSRNSRVVTDYPRKGRDVA